LQRLLRSWFDVGFLDLQRITWNSPAALLEKLVNYEAVHRIRSWADLKNRLDSDRRCYAFFHHNMSDEPLIFVQVALVKDISDNVQELLDETADVIEPKDADTAIFYSITNTQTGLQGVSFGNFPKLSRLCLQYLDSESGWKNFQHNKKMDYLPTLKRLSCNPWLEQMICLRHWINETGSAMRR